MTQISVWRNYCAIALVSAAVIFLQIAVTRVLSVVVWYHWAFFSISLAMLGIGAPGVWLTFVNHRECWLGPSLLASAVLVPGAIIAIVNATHFFREYSILFCLVCLLPAALANCVVSDVICDHLLGR